MIQEFKKYLLAVPIISLMVLMATSALADLPTGHAITVDDVSGVISAIAQFIVDISMVLAVIFIVLSGIMTMTAQGNPTKFSSGLLRLKHAIIGAAVVLAAGIIINTIMSVVDGSFFCRVNFLGVCLF